MLLIKPNNGIHQLFLKSRNKQLVTEVSRMYWLDSEFTTRTGRNLTQIVESSMDGPINLMNG